MRRSALALAFALVLALSLSAGAPAFAQSDLPQRFVAVWGHGEARARPDTATVAAGVESEAATARAALSANSAAMEKVIAAVKGLGVAPRDLQTAGIGVDPVYARPKDGAAPHIARYRASNRLRIRLRDLDRLGELLDAVVAAGANVAGGLDLTVAEPDALEDAARAKAMDDAHRKAALLAKAAGVALGPVASISEEGAARPPVPLRAEMRTMQAARVPVETGENTVRVTLRVVYAIE